MKENNTTPEQEAVDAAALTLLVTLLDRGKDVTIRSDSGGHKEIAAILNNYTTLKARVEELTQALQAVVNWDKEHEKISFIDFKIIEAAQKALNK